MTLDPLNYITALPHKEPEMLGFAGVGQSFVSASSLFAVQPKSLCLKLSTALYLSKPNTSLLQSTHAPGVLQLSKYSELSS